MKNDDLLKEILINQSLLVGASALLISLVEEMHDKGLIDSSMVMKRYESNIEESKKQIKILEDAFDNE